MKSKAELSRETFIELRELMDAAFKAEKNLSGMCKAYHEKFLRNERVHAKVSSLVRHWQTQTCFGRGGSSSSPSLAKPLELS